MIGRLFLIPFVPIYWVSFRIHQVWLRKSSIKAKPLVPMLVVGGLRAGGSGKTSVVIELAQQFTKRGLKVGVLAYWINGYKQEKIWKQVERDWEGASDEAVLIQKKTGLDVYVTRNRERAWWEIASQKKYDLLISDDGFQDPRLVQAYSLVLHSPQRVGFWNLLPLGRYRETSQGLKRGDREFVGPLPWQGTEKVREGQFYRQQEFPQGFAFDKKWVVLCALGDNQSFIEDLKQNGVRVEGVYGKRDHVTFKKSEVKRLKRIYPMGHFLMSEKDFIKFEGLKRELKVTVIKQKIIFSPNDLQKLFFDLKFGSFFKLNK